MSLLRFVVCILLANPAAHAYFNPALQRGMGTTDYLSPNNYAEKCIISSDLPFGIADGRNMDNEQSLCGLDMHRSPSIGVCPKYGSTNPALEIYGLKENDKASFEANICSNSAADPEPQKVAKFKQSVSCSYAPGFFAYYHLTRLFAGPIVPPSVIRTYDKEIHSDYRDMAIAAIAANPRKKDSLIAKTWGGEWGKAYNNLTSTHAHRVFTEDLKGIYGVLSVNPVDEEYYREVNGSIKSYDTRFDGFTATPTYQRIMDPRPVAQLTARDFTQSAQIIQQMRDVSAMLILDHLLGQADRPGNIAYSLSYWRLGPNGMIERQEKTSPGFIPIKELLMKDNDCNLVKSNETKNRGLLRVLAHVHPQTYKGLQQLVREFQTNGTQMADFLKREWLFTDGDVKTLKDNSAEVAAHLKSRCLAGTLHQDLDLKEFLAGGAATHSCD